MTILPFPDNSASSFGEAIWLTLPLAPQAVARSRFAGEEPLAKAVPLQGAMSWISDLQQQGEAIGGFNLDGPGDPLATPAMTMEIIARLRSAFPALSLSLTTMGFGLGNYAEELAGLGVKYVILLMDGATVEMAEKLFRWIRPGKRNMGLAKAAAALLAEQIAALRLCRQAGIDVTITTHVYKGVNEGEVVEIARLAASHEVQRLDLVSGQGWLTPEEQLPLPESETMQELLGKAKKYLKATLLQGPGNKDSHEPEDNYLLPKPSASRPNVAVLSSNGMDIDLHLGQAIKAVIYGPRDDGLACLLEARDLPEPGCGDQRWHKVAEVLDDCFILLASSAGQRPRQILGEQGLTVHLLEDNVEGTVDVLYGGGKRGKCKK